MRSEEVISNVRVGRPDVKPTAPAHTRGVYQGNRHHRLQRPKGFSHEEDLRAEGTARRSTGINARDHDVIDPRMPRISPP